jgi:hypothetical protein
MLQAPRARQKQVASSHFVGKAGFLTRLARFASVAISG